MQSPNRISESIPLLPLLEMFSVVAGPFLCEPVCNDMSGICVLTIACINHKKSRMKELERIKTVCTSKMLLL